MKVDRDVVIDLLPVYFSDEASTATRALVEECFREDPELEQLARTANSSVEALKDVPVSPDQWKEKVALEHLLEKAESLYAVWTVAFILLMATMFQVRDHKPVFVLWKESPLLGLIYAVAACILGFALFQMRARSAALPKYFHFWTAALFCTLALPFVFHKEGHKIVWFFYSDQPIIGAFLAFLAVGLWMAYFIGRRKGHSQIPKQSPE